MITSGVTACGVLGVLALGMGIAYAQGGWEEILKRIFTWHLFPAIGLYFPWAMLQQTLFQFYLLGRLRVALPSSSPLPAIALTGIGYALVHLPDLELVLKAMFDLTQTFCHQLDHCNQDECTTCFTESLVIFAQPPRAS